MAVWVEAAIEFVVDQTDVRSRLSQDPNFARILYDALYLPARSWECGEASLNTDREALRVTLEARMAEEDHADAVPNKLSEADLDLLHSALLRLVALLWVPKGLELALGSPAFGNSDDAKKY